jgi:hypothetical protein
MMDEIIFKDILGKTKMKIKGEDLIIIEDLKKKKKEKEKKEEKKDENKSSEG